jgi:RNA polymerase sigma-70 factor (ECF subfamily)
MLRPKETPNLEPPPNPPLETTAALLDRARAGDDAARDRLFQRVLPPLRRWAHQRLPSAARDLQETDDMVQLTILRACRNLDAFEDRGPGALLGYLRQILLNAIRDEMRRVAVRPSHGELAAAHADAGPSPLEQIMGRDALERYEEALLALAPETREAVILRLELGLSFQEVAEVLRKPSANAARMSVARALIDLAELMRERRRS